MYIKIYSECINIGKVINTSNTLNYETHPDQVISREIIRSSLKRKTNYAYINFQVNN